MEYILKGFRMTACNVADTPMIPQGSHKIE